MITSVRRGRLGLGLAFSLFVACAEANGGEAVAAGAGGEGVSDPGDGSLTGSGCPNRATLGNISLVSSGWDEGGLCCK